MAPRKLHLAGVAGLALLLAACGGTAATAAPTTAPTTAPSTATDAPTEAPSEATATEAPSAEGPDLGAIDDFAARLAALDSYQVTMEVDGTAGKTSIVNTTVRNPVGASKYEVSTPDGQAIAIVMIGDEAWISQDGTTFVSVPASTVDNMLSSLRPELLLGAFQVGVMSNDMISTGTETKNGQQAQHYHLDDQTPVPPGGPTVPPGMVADFWITDDGLLVAFEASGLSTVSSGAFDTLNVQITNINDAGLQVERPE